MADSRNKPSIDLVGQAVKACLSRHAKPGESVTVGFSGGLDSTVLLHAANRLVKKSGLDLSALHVHHGLNVSADAWVGACTNFCDGLNIPFTVSHVQVIDEIGEGLEAAARRVRHKAFKKCSADWILLGHHADDQAETILHNLLRGAGVRGCAGIPSSRGRILRPFLALSRETLLDYARTHVLAWVEDDSNSDKRFTRNFLRHEIVPAIASRFPKASERLAAAATRFSEANSLLEELASMDLRGHSSQFPLPLSLFHELPDTRGRNLLRAVLAWNDVQVPNERRLREFVRQLRTAGADRHPRLDLGSYSLWCQAGQLNFSRRD